MNSCSNYSDVSDNPAAKRRRISLACSACRTRKSRCDRVRPKCSGCAELGFECIYINSASTSNVIIGKEYLSSLEDRLKAVEQDVRALRAKPNRLQLYPRFEGELVDGSDGQRDRSHPHTRNLQSEEVEVNRDQLQDSFGDENSADGMGAMVFSAEEDCGVFGSSSNTAFTRHISRAMARTNWSGFVTGNSFSPSMPLDSAVISISQPASPSVRAPAARQTFRDANQKNVNIYALPPEATTRNLIARYFGDTGLLFPYIYEQAFLDTYNEIEASGFTKIRKTWLGLFNMIMAMATSTTVENGLSAEKRALDFDAYYQRATGLCEKQIMRGTSLEMVQYLLSTGQYLQGTQRSVKAWAVHDLAVKGALQLGLHSATAASPSQSLDPETHSGNHEANDHKREVSVDFFSATITLYKIMWNVINQLYGGNIGCGGQTTVLDTVSQLFSIEHQLSEWERLLPPSLSLCNVDDFVHRPELTESAPSSLDCFRVILKLRHHNLRILLHRPILVKFLDIIGKAPGDSDAREANLLHLYYTFNAALVIFASLLILKDRSTHGAIPLPLSISELELHRSLIDVALALRRLDCENRMVDRCAAYLEQLTCVSESLDKSSAFRCELR
ncbi:hypothetical protein L207DRAFT_557987 [Hyaloscypha variabilis F]|uniref:Zn(2)-C6 fungal-type domain-containing protein n=1 Tax=Hyaloscypha variabilis (strain UAMH 11265 / GT02V1 / F) TaxID=1149755 RepID=A0A2J6R4U6_HYAVF|nr:hypothetical protein L207DRAFT_557987 [Hyaloscypha variabilis F]